MNRLVSTLSLCRRAGKLVYGFETVKRAVQQGQAALLLTAAGLSAKTEKETAFLSEKYGVPLIRLAIPMEEMAAVAGKSTGVIAITDPGLGSTIAWIHNETEENSCR